MAGRAFGDGEESDREIDMDISECVGLYPRDWIGTNGSIKMIDCDSHIIVFFVFFGKNTLNAPNI